MLDSLKVGASLSWRGPALRHGMLARHSSRLGSCRHGCCQWPTYGIARDASAHTLDGAGSYSWTLLHYAACGPNVAAVVALLAHGLDVNELDVAARTPAHVATSFFSQPRVLEVLCAAGAAVRTKNASRDALLDRALDHHAAECARILVANGVRLSTVRKEHRARITPELVAFERGVLRCRAVVVVLLGLKKRRHGDVMRELDRFVVLEIAVCIWATRADKGWQGGNLFGAW